MKNYYSVEDIPDLNAFIKRALELKKQNNSSHGPGMGKTLLQIYFNSSLRTRLSTELAAKNLDMNVITMNMNDGWKLELEEGKVMNMDTVENIKDAAKVISQYADILAIRSFSKLKNRKEDYEDRVLKSFMKYAEIPVISLESSILHPLQSLADLITIEESKVKNKIKVVLSWTPHPKALPQAVANSFLHFLQQTDYDVSITHPIGYELCDHFVKNYEIEYNQSKAFEEADYIYAKNWSSYNSYGQVLNSNPDWMITKKKMDLTNEAKFMHCLPVRRNVEATDDVLDSTQSLIYQQAKNRIFAAQLVLEEILKDL